MTETELLGWVIGRCGALDLYVHHSTDSRRDVGPGFPDLVIAGHGGVVFAELKSHHGVLSEDQRAWRRRLRAGGADWRLWQPQDWDGLVIERQLLELARR